MLDSGGKDGCVSCGGLERWITECPKLEAIQTEQLSNIGHEDFLAHSPMDVCFSFF